MSKREYLTLADTLAMHAVLIRKYGGAPGIRDVGALESALYRPQTGYYVDVIQEAAALLESLAINHLFVDGNKRVSFAVTDTFLRLNGYRFAISANEIHAKFIELYDAGRFRFDVLEQWLRQVVQPTPLPCT
ncbi:toxin Doc [mine drainage metagenome]|uniref:Toxin Doc n=1 Tax=mine drainage metagenome TaxID=410659 RepID=A0A1J5PE94_9ZZZZ